MRYDREHMKAFLQLKAQRRVVFRALYDVDDILLRLQPLGAVAIPAQARTGANP